MSGDVLALDLATRFGWAEGPVGGTPRYGSERFAPSGSDRGAVIAGSIRFFQRRFMAFRPMKVVFEAPLAPSQVRGRTNVNTARTLLALPAVVEGLCNLNGIYRVEEAKVSDIRRWFIGSNPRGDLGKKMVIERLRLMGHDPEDDNAADALALWFYTCAKSDPDLDLHLRMTMPQHFVGAK